MISEHFEDAKSWYPPPRSERGPEIGTQEKSVCLVVTVDTTENGGGIYCALKLYD